MNRIVFVVGMHRSGTSVVAGSMVLLGGAAPRRMPPPSPDNPKGYFESELGIHLNNSMLDALGHNWTDIRPMPDDLPRLLSGRLEDCSSVLTDGFPGSALKIMKDPRASVLIPVWAAAARAAGAEPCFVIVLRRPDGSADSLRRRDGIDTDHGLALWMRYAFEAERATRGSPRSFVSLDSFMQAPVAELVRIGRDLDLTWPRQPGATTAELLEFVDPKLLTVRAPPESVLNTMAQEVFSELLRLVDDPQDAAVQQRIDLHRGPFDLISGLRGTLERRERTVLALQAEIGSLGREITAQRNAPLRLLTDLVRHRVLRVLAALTPVLPRNLGFRLASSAEKRDPARAPLDGKAYRKGQ